MRDILRQERGIELALEGNRYFDVRRWKIGETEYNKSDSWLEYKRR